MWVTKLLISPVKKRIFCPKTTKFGPKLAFLVNLGQAMQAYSVPCWWVGWWLWRAGCISQDTYLLYDNSDNDDENHGSWLLGRLRRRLVTAKIDRTGLAALAVLLLTCSFCLFLSRICLFVCLPFFFVCLLLRLIVDADI